MKAECGPGSAAHHAASAARCAASGERRLPPVGSIRAFRLRHETKRNAAEQKRIARHRITSGFGGLAHGGDIDDPKRQAAHDVARALNEAEAATGESQLR